MVKTLYHLFFALILAIFASGCAWHGAPKTLQSYPQDPNFYLENRWEVSEEKRQALKESYLSRHLSPWSASAPREGAWEAFWGLRLAKSNPGYGENRLPNSPEWIATLEHAMQIESYPSRLEAAIITQDTDARVMPTHKPRFYDFRRAGEGYPFDYWQNSALFAGTPVLITHATREGDWLHVEASFVSGWVRATALARAGERFRQELAKVAEWVVPLSDSIPLYDKKGAFIDRARVGKLYPARFIAGDRLTILIASRDSEGEAYWREVEAKRGDFAPFPLRYGSLGGALLAQALMGEKYGWGGMYGNRDCSAMTRDILGSMGLWLPRNSAAQAKSGEGFVSLAGLAEAEKERLILERAIPWASLIYLKGHIMLYIGAWQGRAMVLHDAWGLRSESEGRWMLGGVVISDMSVGEGVEGVEPESLLLHRVEGFRNLLSDSDGLELGR